MLEKEEKSDGWGDINPYPVSPFDDVKMTRGIFKFQVVQEFHDLIDFSSLPIAKVVTIQQGNSKVLVDLVNIDDVIKTLKACKKWLNSP